MSSVCAISA